jgi:hypothetical protein
METGDSFTLTLSNSLDAKVLAELSYAELESIILYNQTTILNSLLMFGHYRYQGKGSMETIG